MLERVVQVPSGTLWGVAFGQARSIRFDAFLDWMHFLVNCHVLTLYRGGCGFAVDVASRLSSIMAM